MSGIMTATRDRTRGAGRGLLFTLIGLVLGAIVGAIATAVGVGWALFTAVDSQRAVELPPLISVNIQDGLVSATSGAGLFLPMLMAAVLGACGGLIVWLVRRHRS